MTIEALLSCAVGVESSHSIWISAWSRSLSLRETPYLLHLDKLFIAVYLTFAQFNLRLKFCLYIIVHILLEEVKFSLNSSVGTQTLHPGVMSYELESGFLGPDS